MSSQTKEKFKEIKLDFTEKIVQLIDYVLENLEHLEDEDLSMIISSLLNANSIFIDSEELKELISYIQDNK